MNFGSTAVPAPPHAPKISTPGANRLMQCPVLLQLYIESGCWYAGSKGSRDLENLLFCRQAAGQIARPQ
eukprot:364786-Chlamydomonas_euryale.AAC.17